MPTLLEILRNLFFGRFIERQRRGKIIKKLRERIKPPKKIKRLKKRIKIKRKVERVKKPRKFKRERPRLKKIRKVPKIRPLIPAVKPRKIRLRRRKIKRINIRELAEAFKLSASTIQEIYNKLKEMETKIPETPTPEANIDGLKSKVEEIEKTAAASGVTLVPEILDLINYTKERIRELELGVVPSDPITYAKTQIEELEREKKNLQDAQKTIEEKYYRREIDETSFKQITDDYEKRLVEINVKLENWKKELARLEKKAKLPEEKAKLPKIPQPVVLRPRKREQIKFLGIKLPKFWTPLPPPPHIKKEEIKKVPTGKIPKEIVKEVIAADIMSKTVYAVKPNDTLNYVVRLFADKKISGAPVLKGNNLVGMISESDIVKFVGTKELLAQGSTGLKILSEIKVDDIMHKSPVFVFEYTKLSEATDLMNKYDITRLPVLNEKRDLVGIVTRSDLMRGISKEILFKLLERREIERILKVETDIDEILQIVERKGSIGVGEIRKRLMLPEDKIEEWGKVLEKHNLIELFYPPIGKPEFRKKIK